MAKGALIKRSMRIAGHRTSIALEPEFWDALEKVAKTRALSLPRLVGEIDESRVKSERGPSLASAIRVHLLKNSAGG